MIQKIQTRYFEIANSSYAELLEQMNVWRKDGGRHIVCFCEANGLSWVKRGDAELRAAYAHADAVCPDGLSVQMLARLSGGKGVKRLTGPELFARALAFGVARGWRHYFYGTDAATLVALRQNVEARCPGVQIVGTYAPGFSDDPQVPPIKKGTVDFLWAALGCPKQEKWCARHKDELGVSVLLPVGAAFDFLAGRVASTPEWMSRVGLCWLWRLLTGGPRVFLRNVRCVSSALGMLVREWWRVKTARQRPAVREVNGMAVVDAFLRTNGLIQPNEVWVHGMWTPDKWLRCLKAKLCGRTLVRMTHGSLSPIYLERQSARKKRLVKPIERLLFALCDRIVVTGPWEAEWNRAWGLKGPFETVDLKQFFDLRRPVASYAPVSGRATRVLYLGRRHPLKGIDALEEAATRLGEKVDLRVEDRVFDEAKERVLSACDVLVLPTLSENFSLVIAEALERGKPVITTDGAPAWKDFPGVTYLDGFVSASREKQVEMLCEALAGSKKEERGK